MEIPLKPLSRFRGPLLTFAIRTSKPDDSAAIASGTKIGKGIHRCLLSDTPIPAAYVRAEGRAGRLGKTLLAGVVKVRSGRVYVPPDSIKLPDVRESGFLMDVPLAEISGYLNPPLYGFTTVGSMFEARQRYALEVFASAVPSVRDHCVEDGGTSEYADFLACALALGVGRLANRLTSFCVWENQGETIMQTFSEQGVGMASDWAEPNPFSGSTGSWSAGLKYVVDCIRNFPVGHAVVEQRDAEGAVEGSLLPIVSTDPPYYSSITYADFSDFFYGIFRHSLGEVLPKLFATIATPKAEEAVAAWHRFDGSKQRAGEHFEAKLQRCFRSIVAGCNADAPVTVYYAFKAKELEGGPDTLVTA